MQRAGSTAVPPAASLSGEGNEVEEVEGPPNPLSQGAEDDGLDLTERCWLDAIDEIWMTDFPPPPDFAGYQSRPYDEDDPDEPYVRACTEEEIAILTADTARARAAERLEDETLRDAWFAHLKEEADASAVPRRRPGSRPA